MIWLCCRRHIGWRGVRRVNLDDGIIPSRPMSPTISPSCRLSFFLFVCARDGPHSPRLGGIVLKLVEIIILSLPSLALRSRSARQRRRGRRQARERDEGESRDCTCTKPATSQPSHCWRALPKVVAYLTKLKHRSFIDMTYDLPIENRMTKGRDTLFNQEQPTQLATRLVGAREQIYRHLDVCTAKKVGTRASENQT